MQVFLLILHFISFPMLSRLVNSLPNGISQRLTQLYFRAQTSLRRDSHSLPADCSFDKMDVKIIPALTDNYMYLLIDKATKEAAVIDPVEPKAIIKSVQDNGLNLTTVLTTHHHWDHAGGNEEIKELMPSLKIYGGDDRIASLTKMVHHDEHINIGNLVINCLFTPCHTSGHICYYVTTPQEGSDRVVFTGDTLFLGGCGRFFEGTADQMFKALCQVLSKLPEETKVFCGHEYTVQNLKFALFVEPENEDTKKKIEWSIKRREKGLPTVPSTLAEEKTYNPFMRVTCPSVMAHAGVHDPVKVMKLIRKEKDDFKG